MKIAIVTNDNEIVNTHFGRAMKYFVLIVDEGLIVSREIREKTGHLVYQ